MLKRLSTMTRLFLIFLLSLLFTSAVYYSTSNHFFSEASTAAYCEALVRSIPAEESLLMDYRMGKISLQQLQTALNPALNPEGNMYMLLDEEGAFLAGTFGVENVLTAETLSSVLEKSTAEEAVLTSTMLDKATLLLMLAQKTQAGYVLIGKTLPINSGSAIAFRSNLVLTLCVMTALMLMLSTLSVRRVSKPVKVITTTATRLAAGEQVTIQEDVVLPEFQEIAHTFNVMSGTITRAIIDLRNEKESVELALEGLSEGVISVDHNGSIVRENTSAKQLLGEDTDEYRQVMNILKEQHTETMWEGKLTRGDRILYYRVNCLPDEEGQIDRVMLIRDITEEEHLERTRHDYVANISHELRTPLASIRGIAEGLRDGMVPEEKDRQRFYHIIVDEATRLSRLVNDLLELSSLQSNPSAFEMERVDPNELIYDLYDRNGSLFVEKQLIFEMRLPEEPLPNIVSNEDRLSEVLTIFLDNARKYTPEGGKVLLAAEQTAQGVKFLVRDTGIGMDEETRRLAFERFHQAEKGRSDKGSGLGLSIAREILQKMKIEIYLESELGQGSTFSFVVPLHEKEQN